MRVLACDLGNPGAAAVVSDDPSTPSTGSGQVRRGRPRLLEAVAWRTMTGLDLQQMLADWTGADPQAVRVHQAQ